MKGSVRPFTHQMMFYYHKNNFSNMMTAVAKLWLLKKLGTNTLSYCTNCQKHIFEHYEPV